ncbi:MAG: hypothetical protein CSB21_03335 [Deltaproteobacteria bacterium]|nr:MAG: hypothetical protein CSB21_03335 [Deltaproteobacteria bacterium]
MKSIKFFVFLLCLSVFPGAFLYAQTINVDLSDPDYYRPFYEPELVKQDDGSYQCVFTDTFVFTLAEGGKLSFTLSEKDSRGMFFPEWVDITDAGFEDGAAPSTVTPWEKEDPYYNGSNLVSTYTWDYLADGTYNLLVSGSAYAKSYPSTHYWMENVTFEAGASSDPVPEPSTLLILGIGLLGFSGFFRRKKNN